MASVLALDSSPELLRTVSLVALLMRVPFLEVVESVQGAVAEMVLALAMGLDLVLEQEKALGKAQELVAEFV